MKTDGDDQDRYFLSDAAAGAILMVKLKEGEVMTRENAGFAIYPHTLDEWLKLDTRHRLAYGKRAFQLIQSMSRWNCLYSEPETACNLRSVTHWYYLPSEKAGSLEALCLQRKKMEEFI